MKLAPECFATESGSHVLLCLSGEVNVTFTTDICRLDKMLTHSFCVCVLDWFFVTFRLSTRGLFDLNIVAQKMRP